MIRIPRFLLSRNEFTGSHFLGKDKFTSRLRILGSRLGISTSGLDHAGNAPSFPAGNYSRTSASYTIFKGKAALSVSPKLPRFCKVDSGSSRVDKMGAVFLTFWPAIGTRKYDWEKKQIFALSPTEVGSLISLGPAESCEFLHDPSMKSSLEGQVKKSLSITPLSNDSGYFLNLTVMNLVQKTNERFSVPVSKAEFTVMRTALSYALPHIMGWDKAMELSTGLYPAKQQQQQHQREVRLDPDFEWES